MNTVMKKSRDFSIVTSLCWNGVRCVYYVDFTGCFASWIHTSCWTAAVNSTWWLAHASAWCLYSMWIQAWTNSTTISKFIEIFSLYIVVLVTYCSGIFPSWLSYRCDFRSELLHSKPMLATEVCSFLDYPSLWMSRACNVNQHAWK